MILHNPPKQNHKILTLPNNQSLHLILVIPKHKETSFAYTPIWPHWFWCYSRLGLHRQPHSIFLNPLLTAKHRYALHVNMDPLRNVLMPHLPMHSQIKLKHWVTSYLSITWYLDPAATFFQVGCASTCQYKYCTLRANHYSKFFFGHLQETATSKETIFPKEVFETYAA